MSDKLVSVLVDVARVRALYAIGGRPARALFFSSIMRKEPDMDFSRIPNVALLARLIGRRAATSLYRGSLKPLFDEESPELSAHAEKFAAARELVKRWLEEDLKRGDALSSPMAARQYLKILFAGMEREVFAGLFLDSQHRLIAGEPLFVGTLTQTSVYPREVVKHALRLNAAALIFAHNHPSGVAEPSRADELLTKSLKQALALVDIRTLDHFIVAGNTVTSFAERGLL
jgi:DNA repair protein RadC